ncbi:opioid-binding protein/cell adhesion molecule-like [Gadus chalcogrammus]|uniref:opioid-binding protein/cell adhesion molecule-like n=1 Tax=Gadus chalcogrammus TaxID=1042646 RepID=UPI0024C3267F|nr:opioid-binding protein/cell adhesion molecule-like [Gadus chalcogrammus]
MGFGGFFAVPGKCLVVLGLKLLFLIPAGVPARSGDSLLKDNITVRQGDSAVLKCSVDSKVTRVAWLNRTTILFAGSEKWTLDPRVVLMENTPVSEYSIKILSVDVHDEGPYVCTILTNKKPKSTKVHLIVQVPARITNISQAVTVNEGSNVNLVCLALGRPEPSVVWKHHSVRGEGADTPGCRQPHKRSPDGRQSGHGRRHMIHRVMPATDPHAGTVWQMELLARI